MTFNPNRELTLTCPVIGTSFKTVIGEVITATVMSAFDSFEKPEVVKPVLFTGYKSKDGVLIIIMPVKSVVILELKK
jgi:alpha-N-arabinofuranosidase